ncbi:enoyl-CoA hydratase-related protein (plasmid) [Sulfitobacter sp. LCG007]
MTAAFRIETEGVVARVTLSRPEVRNALRPGELHALAEALSRLGADSAVQLIVLTGEGTSAFCAGLDLKDRAAMLAELEGEGPTGLGAVLRAARSLRPPILGRVNGACVAGGLGLLSACFHSVAAGTAVFALPEVRVGLFPHVVLAGWRDRVSPGALDRMAASGDPANAEEARGLGLIDEVVAPEALDAAVRQAARRMLERPGVPPRPDDFERRLREAEERTRAHHRSRIEDIGQETGPLDTARHGRTRP